MCAPALLCLALSGCSGAQGDANDSGNPEDYVARVAAARVSKDTAFARDTNHPVPERQRPMLLPLAYFPIDPAYNVAATLTPSTDQSILDMPTSSGEPQKERHAGTLAFTLKGQPMTLAAFVPANAKDVQTLFVPFSDLTNGSGTYQAGRYLELLRTVTGFYQLDFNMAFNPYCYYNMGYECPLPPPENRLSIAVEAGEKVK